MIYAISRELIYDTIEQFMLTQQKQIAMMFVAYR